MITHLDLAIPFSKLETNFQIQNSPNLHVASFASFKTVYKEMEDLNHLVLKKPAKKGEMH